MPFPATDIERLVAIAVAAGDCILPYFQKPHAHGTRSKKDRSPVTEADMAAHNYIAGALARDFPGIPAISEEDIAHAALTHGETYFLIDPLDGTRSFVRGEDEFTVNIALVEGHTAVSGVLGVPARGMVYYGGVGVPPMRRQTGCQPAAIHVRPMPKDGLTLTRSRSHPSSKSKAFLDSLPVKTVIAASSAIKLCWVAEGSADVYPRFGTTMEWDTAAGHAILDAAGGCITGVDGSPLLYGKPGFENPAFIAWGSKKPL